MPDLHPRPRSTTRTPTGRRPTLLSVDVAGDAALADDLTLLGLGNLVLFRQGTPPARLLGTRSGHPLLHELDLQVQLHRTY